MSPCAHTLVVPVARSSTVVDAAWVDSVSRPVWPQPCDRRPFVPWLQPRKDACWGEPFFNRCPFVPWLRPRKDACWGVPFNRCPFVPWCSLGRTLVGKTALGGQGLTLLNSEATAESNFHVERAMEFMCSHGRNGSSSEVYDVGFCGLLSAVPSGMGLFTY